MDAIGELTDVVRIRLQESDSGPPAADLIRGVLEPVFYASLKTEEGHAVQFDLIYDDDPSSAHLRDDRGASWQYVPFGIPLDLTERALGKVGPATDGRSSTLVATGATVGDLRIVGLVVEAKGHALQRRFEAADAFSPGRFRVSVAGVGHIQVHVASEYVAALDGRAVQSSAIRAFDRGPIYTALRAGIRASIDEVVTRVEGEGGQVETETRVEIGNSWIREIRRLLLRTKSMHHGGAFLLCNEDLPESLGVKYSIDYGSLTESLLRRTMLQLGIHDSASDPSVSSLDRSPLDVAISPIDEANSEIDGAIWFMSLLSRVDGLVLLTTDWRVRGFGVEILDDKPPTSSLLAKDPRGLRRVPIEYDQWGTRHRSMMRFCAHHAGAMGFVVSQDGDVRCFLGEEGGVVVVFDSVQLERDVLSDD